MPNIVAVVQFQDLPIFHLLQKMIDMKCKENRQTGIEVAAENESHNHPLLAQSVGEDGGTHWVWADCMSTARFLILLMYSRYQSLCWHHQSASLPVLRPLWFLFYHQQTSGSTRYSLRRNCIWQSSWTQHLLDAWGTANVQQIPSCGDQHLHLEN